MKEFYNNKPIFFAHRGYLLNKPENTLSSFLEAVKIGAQALEIDVMKTKDKKIVCSHNHYLDIEPCGRDAGRRGRVLDACRLRSWWLETSWRAP